MDNLIIRDFRLTIIVHLMFAAKDKEEITVGTSYGMEVHGHILTQPTAIDCIVSITYKEMTTHIKIDDIIWIKSKNEHPLQQRIGFHKDPSIEEIFKILYPKK